MSVINIMALRHSAFYSPLLMAMAGGFLQDEGLTYHYSQATPDNTVVDNINKGSCHLAQSAVATSFSQLEAGEEIDIVHFAQINSRDGFFIAAREPDADFTWDKLIGKKVLVDHFFQPYAMLKYGLSKQGIDINDLDVIDAGDVGQMDQAFRDGLGDYVHQQGPAPQQLEHDGIGYLVASVGELVGPVAFSSLCASRDWLKTDMADAFLRAYKKSLNYVINAPADEIAAYEYEAGFFPAIDKEVLIETIRSYQQLGCWENDVSISRQAYDNLIDVFMYSGLIKKKYAYESVIAG
ncbi:MAG: ABC transporter substrate-binding protein [Gammaproteobacteria bacterium]|nr:ABC transporter substrate-binding protein [Gammaproteobacteria bacterium]